MKFLITAFLATIMCMHTAYASVPIPNKKPSKSAKFLQILDEAYKPTSPPTKVLTLPKDKLMSGVVLPPQLPPQKQTRVMVQSIETVIPLHIDNLASNDMLHIVNGVPIPQRKPFEIAPLAPRVPQPMSNSRTADIIPYDNGTFDDDRTAGKRGKNNPSIERTPSRATVNLHETSEKSPFKRADLQRFGHPTSEDPVIIFFKEESPDLEVGQLDIIQSDVLNRLNQMPNLRVAVYGYAESNRLAPDKTKKLAMDRTMMISQFLASKRIDPNRIEARSMGDDTPISPKNRVDIIIFR